MESGFLFIVVEATGPYLLNVPTMEVCTQGIKSCETLHCKTFTFGGTLHFQSLCQWGSWLAAECVVVPPP